MSSEAPYSDEIIALVPARSGSKGIPGKNIRDFRGKPLIAHSIEQGKACSVISRVMVSTDSERYAVVARQYGAEVPFLRPPEISGDYSTDLECFKHALGWMLKVEGRVPRLCVHLRPTHPNRSPADIAQAVNLLEAHPEWDSVRSVVPAPETPFKMWFRDPNGRLRPVVDSTIKEAHSQPRQKLPPTFLQNACVDVIRSSTILIKDSMAGDQIGAYEMKDFHDIDTPAQFAAAEAALRFPAVFPTGKTFCFDVDGVIASIVSDNDYAKAGPLAENIRRINRLYTAGNRIVLFTARGYVTKIDWMEITRRQMAEWGVSHHELRFGKPAADYYIDDKMMSLNELSALDMLL